VTYGPAHVIPFQIDLSSLVGRSVASLYSHLVTRPTGRALRLGIESQIGELGSSCLSVLDFKQVVVLDYSCADEAVAKLVQRYIGADRPADVYFVACGLSEQHRDPIEAVLQRHRLALAAEVGDAGFVLLGEASAPERRVWSLLEEVRSAGADDIAGRLDLDNGDALQLLDGLVSRRVALRATPDRFLSLSSLLTRH
jgi:hypothetical protein